MKGTNKFLTIQLSIVGTVIRKVSTNLSRNMWVTHLTHEVKHSGKGFSVTVQNLSLQLLHSKGR